MQSDQQAYHPDDDELEATAEIELEPLWQYRPLVVAFVAAVVMQMLFLNCLCDVGAARMKFAGTVDFLVAVRVAVAWLRRERGDGYRFYVLLLWTSPIWVSVVTYLVLGEW